ncbi:MAG: sulfatase-like hydrolase/transferase [Actinomycetota bacterium]|nr:sulfatase-like hydrolase/transferase [Actinomycetota bacterium]
MASTDPEHPNIVVIVSDDQGPWALGCAGNAELATPELDRLSAEGTRFDRFFCASPVCSPARASLLTGRMPSAHGVHDWIRGEAYGIPDEGGVHYLAGLQTTPEVLADAGWTCGLAGKWHLGSTRSPAPGFEFWYAHRTGDSPYVGAPVTKEGRAYQERRYFTDAVTEEALGFVDSQAASASPFYLSVNYTAPHSPWVGQHPAEYLDRYADCDFASCPQEEPHPWFSWEPGPVSNAMLDPRPSLQGYFASITAMDAGIGRLLARIDETGLRESTVVAFVSDNGFSCGQHGIWGKGNATWPLNLWENSVRVPAIVRQPGRVAAGQITPVLASACDLHPTLLSLAGVPVPADPLAAGRSLVPVLTGTPGADREAVFAFDEYGGARMVRTTDRKLVVRAGDLPAELYDLEEDPDERVDLARHHGYAGQVRELEGVLRDWFAAHTDAHRDAFGRAVSGRGQLCPVTSGADDATTYFQGATERRVGDAARGSTER